MLDSFWTAVISSIIIIVFVLIVKLLARLFSFWGRKMPVRGLEMGQSEKQKTELLEIQPERFRNSRKNEAGMKGLSVNKVQRVVILTGAAIMVLMLIYPPFHVTRNGVTSNMGYAFIMNPPNPIGKIYAEVNHIMLLVQVAIAVIVVALSVWALSFRQRSK